MKAQHDDAEFRRRARVAYFDRGVVIRRQASGRDVKVAVNQGGMR